MNGWVSQHLTIPPSNHTRRKWYQWYHRLRLYAVQMHMLPPAHAAVVINNRYFSLKRKHKKRKEIRDGKILFWPVSSRHCAS